MTGKYYKVLYVLSIFLIISIISGCSINNKNNYFLGTWTGSQNPDNPKSDIYQITIEQNDNKFIIKSRKFQYTENNEWLERPEKIDDAILKDDKLIKDQNTCYGIGKLSPATYTYVAKSDAILYSGYSGFYLYKDTDNKVLNELLSYKSK